MPDNSEKLLSLAREEIGDLTKTEEKLFRAAAQGDIADYRVGSEERDDPCNAHRWGSQRTIRADRIAWLCGRSKIWNVSGNGAINITGAKIEGALRLDYMVIEVPLHFYQSVFEEPISLLYAKLRTLALEGTHVLSVEAEGINVEGPVSLRNGLRVGGRVSVYDAKIGGNLDCTGSQFINEGGDALLATAVGVRGAVFLNGNFVAKGKVRLYAASIGSNLECDGGHFINPAEVALDADNAQVDGHVFLRNNFKAEGSVRLLGIGVGGNLECGGGAFINEGGDALNAIGAKVSRDVFLNNTFVAKGGVNLYGATIGGNLDCSGSNIVNLGRLALDVERGQVNGHVFLNRGFRADGIVRLYGTTIVGNLECDGGHFENPEGVALHAERANIAGHAFLSEKFHAEGTVNLLGARVGANLICQDGAFYKRDGEALMAVGVGIAGNAFLDKGFLVEGQLNLVGIRVGRTLSMVDIHLATDITKLDLGFAVVATLDLHKGSWPGRNRVVINGLKYDSLGSNFPADNSRQCVEWLRLQPEKPFSFQPYEQLAKVLRASGYESEAIKVLIVKKDDLRRYGDLGWWDKLSNLMLSITIRHGYLPHLALVWMLLFVLLGAGIFGWSFQHKLMTRTDFKVAEAHYPKFNKFIYSLDTFLPIIDLKQKSYWLPDGNATIPPDKFRWGNVVFYYLWVHMIVGWLLTTLWVAGFSGLVRRLS